MGFVKAPSGTAKPPARLYVDEGFKLTKKLIRLLDLSDWEKGTPVYTEEEASVVDGEWRDFQRMLNAEVRRRGKQAPEFMEIQRTFGSESLRRLAGPSLGWELDGDCPDDWKARVSTYLKAWVMNQNPDALIEMAQLLALAGYKAETKQCAAIVARWFPNYAPGFFSGTDDPKVVSTITARAIGINIS